MASTYSSLHYHLVFATKSREPWIVPAWRGRLHDYLGGTIAGLGGVPQARGALQTYIANQEKHHRLRSYREELDTMLRKAGIEYDPQYID